MGPQRDQDDGVIRSVRSDASVGEGQSAGNGGTRGCDQGAPAWLPSRLLSRPVFVTAIVLSAFLLFALELLVGSLVQPVFGGTPSVWTTALCFFTAIVFVGYLYAHLVATHLSQRSGAVLHLGIATAVVVATLAAPTDLAALRITNLPVAINVLVVFALIAGAPALLFAATTPLLSAWFSQLGRAPWWLYAVSNGASLGGLLAYPLLIAPFVRLSVQRTALVWLVGALVILLGCIAVGSLGLRGVRRAQTSVPSGAVPASLPADRAAAAAGRLTFGRQAVWLFAACVPAGLMSATTAHITTDHISAPLLWIGPLGVYLLSFVVAFSKAGPRIVPIAEKLVPAAATLMWVPYLARVNWPAGELMALLLGCLGVLAVAVHGRLALDRPREADLTRFYLVISAGGMVATGFVALVAPVIFSDIYEYPIFLVGVLAALAMLPGSDWLPERGPGAHLRAAARRLPIYLLASAALVVTLNGRAGESTLYVAVLLFVGLLVVIIGRTPRSLALASGVVIAVLLFAFSPNHLARVRTFYGITQVRSDRGGAAHTEIHGTTLHGLQFLDARRIEPTAYFVRSGPVGDLFANLDARSPRARIGVTGLGIGTMAAYARDGDSMVFFEVDPAVVSLARDTRYFTYLAQAPSEPQIIVGDGRLSLDRQPADEFDLLILDAFSSDSVPTQLLTREAMHAYLRTLKPDAVMAFQLTNRHFDLAPAVASTARAVGLDARVRQYTPSDSEQERLSALPSKWLVVGRPGDLTWFEERGWDKPPAGPVLSDDYSDIIRLIR